MITSLFFLFITLLIRNDIVKLKLISFCESLRPTTDSRNPIIWIFNRKSGNIGNARGTYRKHYEKWYKGRIDKIRELKKNSEDNFEYEKLKR